MSRALDKTVKEALKKGDHVKVYDDLAELLAKPSPQEPLQIEVLGSSHPLQDGENCLKDEEDARFVAIPKLRIVQAFIIARRKLFAELEYSKTAENPPSREVMRCTAVMLLMDPEHLTAANTRKRFIKHSMSANDANETRKLFKAELHLLRSLLTSHLHRHTKSPTLWSHRRWVIDQARAFDPQLQASLTADLVDEVFVSAERHPRNYYAWSHARYLVELGSRAGDGARLSEAVEETKKWCFKHHDDVSGWMYLLFLVSMLGAEERSVGKESCEGDSEQVFRETINLVKSFRWRNESVWYFLRNLISSGLLGDKEKAIFSTVLGDLEKGASASDMAILRRTGAWVKQSLG